MLGEPPGVARFRSLQEEHALLLLGPAYRYRRKRELFDLQEAVEDGEVAVPGTDARPYEADERLGRQEHKRYPGLGNPPLRGIL
jgi:hypothetical protein